MVLDPEGIAKVQSDNKKVSNLSPAELMWDTFDNENQIAPVP